MATTSNRERVDQRERFYDSIAHRFDGLMNQYDAARRAEFVARSVAAAGVQPGAAVLEVGTGTGAITHGLVQQGHAVVAMDIGVQLLSHAARKGFPAAVAADALALPFGNDQFDCVVSSECIEHTLDPVMAVSECLRVLRPGGVLVLTTPNLPWRPLVTAASRLRLRPYSGLENWLGWDELRRAVESAGGQVVEHVGLHPLPFQLPLAPRWLPWLERHGKRWERYFINQGVIGVKRGVSP